MISHTMKIHFLRRWGENKGNSNCCCKISNEFSVLLDLFFRDVTNNTNNCKPKEQWERKNNRFWDEKT